MGVTSISLLCVLCLGSPSAPIGLNSSSPSDPNNGPLLYLYSSFIENSPGMNIQNKREVINTENNRMEYKSYKDKAPSLQIRTLEPRG